jgi:hypothetical protein
MPKGYLNNTKEIPYGISRGGYLKLQKHDGYMPIFLHSGNGEQPSVQVAKVA